MSTEMRMPKLGDIMESGIVTRWLKESGEWVRMGEPLYEVQGDKATIVIDATVDGYLERTVPEGAEVPVGGLIAILDQYPQSPADRLPAT